MRQHPEELKEVESYLADNFPLVYLEYCKEQELSHRDLEISEIERKIFEILIKEIETYMAENCQEIIVQEIKNFMKSPSFRNLVASWIEQHDSK